MCLRKNDKMNNYIAYLDLLGTKDLAKYSPDKYFDAIKEFRNHLIRTADVFNYKQYLNKSEIHFFSDSAFIESDNIEALIDYFIKLRKELHENKLFFTAAITIGSLKAFHLNGEINSKQEIIDLELENIIKGKEKIVRGTIFQDKDIISVFNFQNDLKCIGIFMDEKIFYAPDNEELDEKLKEIKKKYLKKIFYFPKDNRNEVREFYDLKLSDSELNKAFFRTVIERYHNANLKSKKFGRYYLPYFANWISCIQFDEKESLISELLSSKKKLTETNNNCNDDLLVFFKLIDGDDVFLKELKRSAQGFEYLYFFLLNCLYNEFDKYNKFISISIDAIKKYSKCKTYITKIDELPINVLSSENKHRFIEDYNKETANNQNTS